MNYNRKSSPKRIEGQIKTAREDVTDCILTIAEADDIDALRLGAAAGLLAVRRLMALLPRGTEVTK
ncbi:hypothetical protein LCGC14_0561960 [marine sediment metagenome]|uniref:Uncharacterized protein n=1 Tax=marine sediment metagenome TaxID=412755 RepID=A0A0F9RS07_9ZZZZ